MRRRWNFVPLAFVLLPLASDSRGSITVALAAAPMRAASSNPTAVVRSFVVALDQVYLQSEADGRVVLTSVPKVVNLVDVAQGVEMIAEDVDVPTGTYSQLRIVVSEALLEIEVGEEVLVYATPGYPVPEGVTVAGRLQMPSYAQSGLKIKLGAGENGGIVVDGNQRILMLTFNIDETLQTWTGSGKLMLHPVILASSFELTGGVEVSVSADVSVMNADAVLSLTSVGLTDRDGNTFTQLLLDVDGDHVFTALFPYLPPSGSPYTLVLQPPASKRIGLAPSTVLSVDVVSGLTTRVSILVTEIVDVE